MDCYSDSMDFYSYGDLMDSYSDLMDFYGLL